MSNSIEVKGRSVEDAVNNALAELGVSRDSVTVEVLEQAEGGLFGLMKRQARVRVSLIELDRPELETLAEVAADVDSLVTEVVEAEQDEDEGVAEAVADFNLEIMGSEDDETEAEDEAAATGEVNLGEELAYQILSAFDMDEAVVREYDAADDVINLYVEHKDGGVLIGRRGDTLNALQHLLSLAAGKGRRGGTRIYIDVNSYRYRQEERLADMARRTAEQVRRSGRTFEMNPMKSADRRIVHAALADFPGVVTFSEDEGGNRRVIIAPARDEG